MTPFDLGRCCLLTIEGTRGGYFIPVGVSTLSNRTGSWTRIVRGSKDKREAARGVLDEQSIGE